MESLPFHKARFNVILLVGRCPTLLRCPHGFHPISRLENRPETMVQDKIGGQDRDMSTHHSLSHCRIACQRVDMHLVTVPPSLVR